MSRSKASDLDGVDDFKLKEMATLNKPVSTTSSVEEKDKVQHSELSGEETSHGSTTPAPFTELFRYEEYWIRGHRQMD